MEFTGTPKFVPHTQIPGLPGVVAGIILTEAERKQLSVSRATIDSINSVGRATAPAATWNGFQCELGDMERKALQVLTDSPTLENAKAYHSALMDYTFAEKSYEGIGEALETAHQRERASLLIVCNAILDRCQAVIDQEAETHRAAIKDTIESPVFGSIGPSWEQRIKDILIAVTIERDTAKKTPLEWLAANGFYDQADQPAKAKK